MDDVDKLEIYMLDSSKALQGFYSSKIIVLALSKQDAICKVWKEVERVIEAQKNDDYSRYNNVRNFDIVPHTWYDDCEVEESIDNLKQFKIDLFNEMEVGLKPIGRDCIIDVHV